MFDELYCDAALPDYANPVGTCFQTKSFPDPCLSRYRITGTGRLIDPADHDLEPEGYITFYTLDILDEDLGHVDRRLVLRLYRAKFLRGQLLHIMRIDESVDDGLQYGLASFRWFDQPSFLFGDPNEGC